MAWWIWITVGVVLMLLELMTPGGFFILFFGLSAILVGLLVGVGAGGPAWAQAGLFTVLGVVSLALFRRRVLAFFRPSGALVAGMADVVGGIAVPLDDIEPGKIGKADYRGAQWSAKNAGAARAVKGQRCRIEKVDGLMLLVRPE